MAKKTKKNKWAVIGDTHFGFRNDHQHFLDYFSRFYEEIFFPAIDKEGIQGVIHMGDLTDRRKYANFNTVNQMRSKFLDRIQERNLPLHVAVGNHDCFFKNTNSVNSISGLLKNVNGIHIYEEATEVLLNGVKCLFLPWINPENKQTAFDLTVSTDSVYCFGHLELAGFPRYKNSPVMDKGYSSEPFARFKRVLTGHYHTPSSRGNIHFLGAPYEMYSSDMDDWRGFSILDLDTDVLTPIENPRKMFCQEVYDDVQGVPSKLLNNDPKELTGKIVLLNIVNKTNPNLFDKYMKALENTAPYDVVLSDTSKIFTPTGQINEKVLSPDDTPVVLRHFISNLDVDLDKDKIEEIMMKLYSKAIQQ